MNRHAWLHPGIIIIEDVELPVMVNVVYEDADGFGIRYNNDGYECKSYVPKRYIELIAPPDGK